MSDSSVPSTISAKARNRKGPSRKGLQGPPTRRHRPRDIHGRPTRFTRTLYQQKHRPLGLQRINTGCDEGRPLESWGPRGREWGDRAAQLQTCACLQRKENDSMGRALGPEGAVGMEAEACTQGHCQVFNLNGIACGLHACLGLMAPLLLCFPLKWGISSMLVPPW